MLIRQTWKYTEDESLTRAVHMKLRNVLYAPGMHATLISLGCLDSEGYYWSGEKGELTICNKNYDIIGVIPRENNLYRVYHPPPANANAASTLLQRMSLADLHQSLAHVNYRYLEQMAKSGRINGIVITDYNKPECPTCLQAKARRAVIAPLRESLRAERFGDHVHMDTWGPASVMMINHCRYFLTLVDDHGRWLDTPLLRMKSEAFAKYVAYNSRLTTQLGYS